MSKQHAERIIRFCEMLKVPDGMHVGQQIVLRPWQRKFIEDVYGPRDKQGNRIVREAILSIGRKNSKTAMIAMLNLVHLCGPEAVANSELYSLGFEREQAAQVFKFMSAMVYASEALSNRLRVIETRRIIRDPVSGSVYEALSSESKSKHGRSSAVITYDELAQFGQDRRLYDVMHTSTGAHSAPLEFYISTQAENDQALFSELIDYGKSVNKGEIKDKTFVAHIYEVPKETEDIWDEKVWYLANPALGDFKNLETMRNDAEKAKRSPAAEATFRNLHLNQRVSAADSFITDALWKANGAEPNFSIFEDEQYPVYAGLDLSSKNDLTSFKLVCFDEEDDAHVMSLFFAPEEGIKDRADEDRVPYDVWASEGYLITTPGRTIDYHYVALQIQEAHNKYFIKGLRFDRWRMDDLIRELRKLGVPAWVLGRDDEIKDGLCLVPHGQGFKDMNGAVERLEDYLLEGKIRHGMHPVLTMCASNVRTVSDPAGNRKFDKPRSTSRIDGIVALAMALNIDLDDLGDDHGEIEDYFESEPLVINW